MKKFILLICLTVLTLGCGNDEESGGGEPNVSGNWSLIKVTGGFGGLDNSFPQGLIRWNFQNSILTIENDNSSGETDLYPSGIYEYSIRENQGEYFLFIDGEDQGIMEVNLTLFAVDGNKRFEGACNDCFNFVLRK